jgi:predicted O-methyltransferase YrrM
MIGQSKDKGLKMEIVDYINNIGNRVSKGKYDLIQDTVTLFPDDCVMLTNPSEGELLKMLVQLTNGKKGIEIGVFTGYSSICLAEGLPENGKLLCMDISEEFTDLAKRHWKLNNVDHKIELVLGDAISTLEKLLQDPNNLESFDFAYVDADKYNYVNYFEMLLKLLKKNGFIVFDNTLWSFRVCNDEAQDENSVGLRKLNKLLREDDRVDINMLNIADGVTIVRKK